MDNSKALLEDRLKHFSNLREIGSGGQKTVYVADSADGSNFVVKIGVCGSIAELERIRREVSTLSQLNSEYFPSIYEFEVVGNTHFLIVEEFIPGKPLADVQNLFDSERKILELTLNLVEGLQIIWRKSVIHRDIKPQNILIRENGKPVIIDLGIARLLDEKTLTLAVSPIGPCTPEYASPEQLTNQIRNINHRSDQFSLGIVIGRLTLNGAHPFDPVLVGDGENLYQNIIRGRWAETHILEKSEKIHFLLRRFLAVEVYKRYRTPQILWATLNGLIEDAA